MSRGFFILLSPHPLQRCALVLSPGSVERLSLHPERAYVPTIPSGNRLQQSGSTFTNAAVEDERGTLGPLSRGPTANFSLRLHREFIAACSHTCDLAIGDAYTTHGGRAMTTFKAMTWNVENLFRPKPEADEAVKQRYQRKLELLAEVIGRLDPDVVALQEIGGENGQ